MQISPCKSVRNQNPDTSGIRGRGAQGNVKHRFQGQSIDYDNGVEEFSNPETELRLETSSSIISRNSSPDVPFSQSINPYRGCEHGCCYCYARATHAYLQLSPGLDFETKIFAKQNAAELLKHELLRPGYQCETIAVGNNTDAYQPVERKLELTRQIIELIACFKHPFSIITKSSLILRDIELLSELAKDQLVHVTITITSLDHVLSSKLEPRAASPTRRLQVIRRLSEADIPVSVLIAPVIPSINDHELEDILVQAKECGAGSCNYITLRLPHEVEQVFLDWLQLHYPLRADKVKNKLISMHKGATYRSEFGTRMRGSGEYAQLINSRFSLACKKLGFDQKFLPLRTDLFQPHLLNAEQMNLF